MRNSPLKATTRCIDIIASLGLSVLLFGCGEGPSARNYSSSGAQPDGAVATAPPPASVPAEAAGGADVVPQAVPRKIIYNAQLTLLVESLNGFDQQFSTLVKESGGYISQSDRSTIADSRRQATLTVRLPAERFDGFLAAVSRLGELAHSHIDSQDVTQEFYDLEARITNKQQGEKRLLKHLSDSTGKLEDILAVERELSRVRGEVEQMQGRVRYLGNLSALSTVTVTVSEIRNYTPPVHPTFVGLISRTFNQSLANLTEFGKGAVLFVVAVAPWLPLVAIAFLVVRWAVRRFRFGRSGPVVLVRTEP